MRGMKFGGSFTTTLKPMFGRRRIVSQTVASKKPISLGNFANGAKTKSTIKAFKGLRPRGGFKRLKI